MAEDADAAEPLIQETAQDEADPAELQEGTASSFGEIEDPADGTTADLRPSSFVWTLTFAAGVAGLLFGYDTGVISSTLVSIHESLSHRALSTLDKSLITSSTSFFALVASPCSGFLADAIGRKRVILLASVLFIAGALLQACSTTVMSMIAGRSVVGLAIGGASFVAPLYISELSPSAWRGRLVTISSLFITGGQVVAYLVGWWFSETDNGWRWMCGLGALPALVQLVILIAMPETPRWLVKAGRPSQARAVLGKVYAGGQPATKTAEQVLTAIQEEMRLEEAAKKHNAAKTPLTDLFYIGGNRRALTIACMLQGAQQLCGFNSLMYFSATIFALVGFTSPTLTSLTIAVTNFVFTIVAFLVIDNIGRRRMLLVSMPFMVLGLVFCALAFCYIRLDSKLAGEETASTSFVSLFATRAAQKPPATEAKPAWAAASLLISLILYVSSYALGLGNVPWQQSELFPLRVRSIGSSLSTATNWGSNTLVGLTFLPMLEMLSPQVTFLCYAGICAAAWVAVWFCYPETAGLSLEQVGTLLAEGWGVRPKS